MYRQFQHDLYRLRLEAARGYAGVLQKGLSPVSANSAEPVKLHVEVCGWDGVRPSDDLFCHIFTWYFSTETSFSVYCAAWLKSDCHWLSDQTSWQAVNTPVGCRLRLFLLSLKVNIYFTVSPIRLKMTVLGIFCSISNTIFTPVVLDQHERKSSNLL